MRERDVWMKIVGTRCCVHHMNETALRLVYLLCYYICKREFEDILIFKSMATSNERMNYCSDTHLLF